MRINGGDTDLRGQLILWFTAGIALESLYLIRRDAGWFRFACCVGAGLAVGAISDRRHDLNRDDLHYVLAYVTYAALFGFMFKKDILPVVSEKLLLALTVLFWYGFAATFYRGSPEQNVLAGLAIVPSPITVYVALLRPPLGFWLKLFLYAWFLTIVLAIGLFQFPYGNSRIFTVHTVPWLNTVDAVITGMALMYLVVNAAYLYLLIPIPAKNQSLAERMKEWHELTDLMTRRCAEDEPSHAQALLVVGVVAAVIGVNYVFTVVPAELLISATLMACAFLLHVGTTEEVRRSVALGGLRAARS